MSNAEKPKLADFWGAAPNQPSKDAVRLLETMARAVNEPYPESVFLPIPEGKWPEIREAMKSVGVTIDAVSADTVRKCVGQPFAAQRILRALVDELGLSWEDEWCLKVHAGLCGDPRARGLIERQAKILATILEAAGVERDI